ncbi:MAG TPA: hypothetical protein VE690_23515 [Rhodopila sp.]|nr:hypothetical protein [Rhodopila sp.]
MTPKQSEQARRLLEWTFTQAEEASGVPAVHVATYERTGHMAKLRGRDSVNRIQALRAAFERAGLEFKDDAQRGVKLRKAEP